MKYSSYIKVFLNFSLDFRVKFLFIFSKVFCVPFFRNNFQNGLVFIHHISLSDSSGISHSQKRWQWVVGIVLVCFLLVLILLFPSQFVPWQSWDLVIDGQIENHGRTGPDYRLLLTSHNIHLSQEEVISLCLFKSNIMRLQWHLSYFQSTFTVCLVCYGRTILSSFLKSHV